MRVFKIVLIGIASIVCLLLLGVGGLIAYNSTDKEDSFYLQSAEFAEPGYLRSLAQEDYKSRRLAGHFLVKAHRLKPGHGTILAYRFYSNGSSAIDDEFYRKLTLWLPGTPPNTTTDFQLLDGAQILVIYGSGVSAWPESACAGFISNGSVHLKPIKHAYIVHVVGDFVPLDLREGRNSNCKDKHVDLAFEAPEISFSDLTPWLGRVGNHPYDETYR